MSGTGKTLLHERFHWTPEIEDKAARLWNDENKSASEIAEILGGGISRSAVIGKAHRLKGKFKAKRPGDVSTRNRNPRKPRVAANKNAAEELHNPSWQKRKHIARLVASHPSPTELDALVKDWTAKNGQPRQFPRGFSGEWFHLRNKLADLGWCLKMEGTWYSISKIGSAGRPKRLNREHILRRIDEVLIANGMQPFIKRDVLEAAE